MTTYNADYFIAKFEAIPEEMWTTKTFLNDQGQCCALGHCGARDGTNMTAEGEALLDLFSAFPKGVVSTNDTPSLHSTPKQRILAALHDIKAKEER